LFFYDEREEISPTNERGQEKKEKRLKKTKGKKALSLCCIIFTHAHTYISHERKSARTRSNFEFAKRK